MDLATEWRSRRWRRLLNIIDGLPRNSHYVDALSQDDELADVLAAQPEKGGAVRSMTEFSAEVELLSVIADRLAENTQAVAALGRARISSVRPMPRPVTALARARERRRIAKHESLVARLLPDRNKPQPSP